MASTTCLALGFVATWRINGSYIITFLNQCNLWFLQLSLLYAINWALIWYRASKCAYYHFLLFSTGFVEVVEFVKVREISVKTSFFLQTSTKLVEIWKTFKNGPDIQSIFRDFWIWLVSAIEIFIFLTKFDEVIVIWELYSR